MLCWGPAKNTCLIPLARLNSSVDSHSLSAWSEIRDNRDKEKHFLIFLVSQSSLGKVLFIYLFIWWKIIYTRNRMVKMVKFKFIFIKIMTWLYLNSYFYACVTATRADRGLSVNAGVYTSPELMLNTLVTTHCAARQNKIEFLLYFVAPCRSRVV